MLSERENFIRNIRRQGPEWMPCHVFLSGGIWWELREALEEIVLRHPVLFPHYKKGDMDLDHWEPAQRVGVARRDPWGCLWQYEQDGLEGIVIEHPLDDWAKFDGFTAPDPMRYSDTGDYDWPNMRAEIETKRARGEFAAVSLPHGYFLMRLWYLRGFENLMIDIATDEPKLHALIDMLVERNNVIVRQFIEAGAEGISYGEDLGTQTASIISPRDFRKWVVPAYKRMMDPAKRAVLIIETHSDGYIMELVDDMLASGCDVLNPQDLCNGIDNIARTMKGRCCIRLDVDRQKIVPFGTPAEIHELIEEEVRTLGAPEGGLEMVAGIYPPTPIENIEAVCAAFEKWRTFWFDGRA